MDAPQITDFVSALPKCELHLHFEGSIPMELVREWATQPIPESPPWVASDYRYPSFAEFGQAMILTWKRTCNTLERLDQASSAIYSSLKDQNVRYLEMSFGIGAYPYPPDETLTAFKSGVPDGMTVKVIGALSRDRDIEMIRNAGAGYVRSDLLDGLDVHGNETVGDPGLFRDFYGIARERDLILKAHAGEFGGAASVEEALDTLGVTRIEHGVRGIESDTLVERYIRDAITLDVCPWSNVKLGVYPDLATHPISDLYRRGVSVTVNTDDPTLFGQTLTDEYGWLLSECGLTPSEVGEIAKNGFRVANIPENEKTVALSDIDDVVARYDVRRDG